MEARPSLRKQDRSSKHRVCSHSSKGTGYTSPLSLASYAYVFQLMKDQEQNVRSWEAGRVRLIEDHKLKRENEQTHRAALSLPGLLDGTALLRVRFTVLYHHIRN